MIVLLVIEHSFENALAENNVELISAWCGTALVLR